MSEDRLQLGDLVSWTDSVLGPDSCMPPRVFYGVIIRKEMKFVDNERLMYTVYTQRSECINFFQHTAMELRMKVECR